MVPATWCPRWRNTIKSTWVCTVISRYSSWYDHRCQTPRDKRILCTLLFPSYLLHHSGATSVCFIQSPLTSGPITVRQYCWELITVSWVRWKWEILFLEQDSNPWNCKSLQLHTYRQWPYIYIHGVGSTTIQCIACTAPWSWHHCCGCDENGKYCA